MAPLPKRKLSKARQGKRRKGISLKTVSTVSCPNCGQAKLPHQVCQNCGIYDGKQILTLPLSKEKQHQAKS